MTLPFDHIPSTTPDGAEPTPGPTPNNHRRSLLKIGLSSWLVPALGSSALVTACGSDDDASIPVAGPALAPAPAASAPISSFGLVVLPDTQFYSRYATAETGNQFAKRYGSTPYLAQTQWIAANAKALKIPFVIHVGDIVDQVGKPQQWQIADTAMKVLEDNAVPYSVLAGNHDVQDESVSDDVRDLSDEPYLQWFGTSRAQKQATFGARDPSGFHEYHVFSAEGQRFLVLSLSWNASNDGINWARDVLQSHPTLPTILVNHQLIAIANDAVQPLEVDYGLMLWNRLIKSNDQIFMTINGHFHGSARLTKTNEFGNAVEEMVVDYQMAYQGGNGLLRYYEMDLSNNQIRALSFSPWVKQKPVETLNEFDKLMLTDANNQFTIAMDFAKRFAGFAPNFKAATPSSTALTVAASTAILAGYKGVDAAASKPATGPNDFPKVAETLAHWRFFGGTVGSAVADGAVIADASGSNNSLKRGALNAPNGNTALVDDLLWSSDHHRLSSAPGCVQFRNAAGPRLSYFLTDAAAAINSATFTTGYTVEAFIKLDKNWTASQNAWMNIMTRAGRRGNLPGFAGGLPQSPPLQFAISNLKEVQWEVIPEQATPRSSRTNWSGEILLDTWLHVAVVNNPVAKETTMYVEGAPILRNAIDSLGLATLNLVWTIGGGYWDGGGPGGGFLGSIGEIRIAAKPLPPAQWLTARAT